MSVRCHGCMRIKENSPVCEHCGYDERTQNNTHQLPVGTELGGQYILGRVLGQGGFGITYIGWDKVLEQRVAVKEYFPSGYAGRDIRQSREVTSYDNQDAHAFESNKRRFLREAESLSKLWDIPQIVKILRHFEENGTAYIAMEYAEGEDLRGYMKHLGRPMTMEEILNILGPVVEALSYVHRADLVHRDISPDNIMVLSSGSAKLLDFGAARYVENADASRERNTSTQAILKHGFAPPEQYRSHGALGPWTDIYALCATVYFCLTGRIPPESMSRMMGEAELRIEHLAGLSPRQREALEKGMALMPKQRIKSAEELYEALFGEILADREREKQEAEEARQRAEARKAEEQRRLEEKQKQEKARQEAFEAKERRRKEAAEKKEQSRREAQRQKEEAANRKAEVRREEIRRKKEAQARKKQTGKQKKTVGWLLAAAAAIAAAVGAGALMNRENPAQLAASLETASAETAVATRMTEPAAEDVSAFAFTYSDNGTGITITGSSGEAPAELEIPESIDGKKVTAIGDRAFQSKTALQSVRIPEGVEWIGESAFFGCSSLTEIRLPASVTAIEGHAFENTPWMLYQSETFVIVGDGILLQYNGSENTVRIPEGVRVIGDGVFRNQDTLRSVVIPEGVTRICDSAFLSCANLNHVNIPDSVVSIEDSAFSFCVSLNELTLSRNLLSVGSCAFSGCACLYNITIPESVLAIGESAFLNTRLSAVTISAECEAHRYAFPQFCQIRYYPEAPFTYKENETGVTVTGYDGTLPVHLTIPGRLGGKPVTAIGSFAFGYCEDLESVVIPEGVVRMEYAAFQSCKKLSRVTVPHTVTELEENVFADTGWLQNYADPMVICGDGILVAYQGTDAEVVVPDTVKQIGPYAFADSKTLKSVILPDTVHRIGRNAFSNCGSLEELVLPAQIRDIQGYAFDGTPWLDARKEDYVIVGDGVLIKYNGTDTHAVIPSGVKTIASAFSECMHLAEVTVPEGVTTIGMGAFSNCFQLKRVNLSDSVCDIGTFAFTYCTNLQEIFIPDSVKIIGISAFANCYNLKTVSNGRNLTKIADFAFQCCYDLTDIVIAESVEEIGYYTFSFCSLLRDVAVPAGCRVSQDAFPNTCKVTYYETKPARP